MLNVNVNDTVSLVTSAIFLPLVTVAIGVHPLANATDLQQISSAYVTLLTHKTTNKQELEIFPPWQK